MGRNRLGENMSGIHRPVLFFSFSSFCCFSFICFSSSQLSFQLDFLSIDFPSCWAGDIYVVAKMRTEGDEERPKIMMDPQELQARTKRREWGSLRCCER